MRAVKPAPSRDEFMKIVEEAGSSDEQFFGYPVREDGLYLQQDSEEFAAFLHFMATKARPAEYSMDIGIASGGQTKLLRDYYPCEKTIVVDIGTHPVFPHWKRIKQDLNSDLIEEVIADSHAPSTREKLLKYTDKIDFAYVDGDHSYHGLRKDIFLTKELLKVGGLMVLHDTLGVWDCKRVFDDLIQAKDFSLVRNLPYRFGISIWQLTRKVRMPTAFNRSTGRGKL